MATQSKQNKFVVAWLLGGHVILSFVVSLIARSPYLSNFHNGQGVWNYAGDSSLYHAEALRLLELLNRGQIYEGLTSGRWWHTKWIALSYMTFGPDPLAFSVINAIIWVASTICFYNIVLYIMPERTRATIICTAIFSCWPSYLLHTIQLLKDLFFVLGILLFLRGWIGLLTGHRWNSLVGYIVLGALLAYLIRDYGILPLTCLSFLAMFLAVYQSRGTLIHSLIAVCFVVGMLVVHNDSPGNIVISSVNHNAYIQQGKKSDDAVLNWFTAKVLTLSEIRARFVWRYSGAGSNIDEHVIFRNLLDIIYYIPRALQIGYLAPFPSHWLEKGVIESRVSRVLSGIEMIVLYFLLFGSIFYFFNKSVTFSIRIWLLLYSVSFVLITSLAVPNLGALYRFRYIYFLPIINRRFRWMGEIGIFQNR